MARDKYIYDPKKLSFEKIELSLWQRLRMVVLFFMASAVMGMILLVVFSIYFDSPKERLLKRENADLLLQYRLLNKKIGQMTVVLADIERRDDNIYRTIFGAEPIPPEVRHAGYGGVNRYKDLEAMSNASLVIESSKKVDQLAKEMYIQSKSFDKVVELARKKETMLACVPAIQPVSNKDLRRVASGYGYRIDPVYGTSRFHNGMDFTCPTGTEIYATGDGVVIRADSKSRGFGNHVRINHGFGYVSLYAHMSRIAVRPGQKVKRGDVIGYVGCTGKCVGPHVHYEVHKNGKPINPVNFYFNDLTPEQYDKLIEMSATASQSLD